MNLLFSLLLSFPPGNLVQLNQDQIYAWELPPSISNRYLVYSFDDAKELKKFELRLNYLENSTALQDDGLKKSLKISEALTIQVSALEDKNRVLSAQSDRRNDEFNKCAETLAKKQDSIFPVVVLSAGLTTFILGGVLIYIAGHK